MSEAKRLPIPGDTVWITYYAVNPGGIFPATVEDYTPERGVRIKESENPFDSVTEFFGDYRHTKEEALDVATSRADCYLSIGGGERERLRELRDSYTGKGPSLDYRDLFLEAVELLRPHEWITEPWWGYSRCITCGAAQDEGGHEHGCRVAALLALAAQEASKQ